MKGMNTMRKPLKVFLSGPISSRLETYKAEFDDAARIVSEAGHLPLNPATLPIGMENRDYMRICLAMLDSADLLLQLPGWGKSAGAIAERTVAMKTGVESLTLEDFIREYGPERVPAEPEPPSEPEQLLSRVERLFGRRESWPNATAAATPSQGKDKAEAEEAEDTGPETSFSRRAVKGFLIVECENCGQTREFCSRAEINQQQVPRMRPRHHTGQDLYAPRLRQVQVRQGVQVPDQRHRRHHHHQLHRLRLPHRYAAQRQRHRIRYPP